MKRQVIMPPRLTFKQISKIAGDPLILPAGQRMVIQEWYSTIRKVLSEDQRGKAE